MTVNGNEMQVSHLVQSPTPTQANRYGRLGLTISEGMELTYYKGILDGMINCAKNPVTVGKAVMERLTREARGEVIEIATAEQLRAMETKCQPPQLRRPAP